MGEPENAALLLLTTPTDSALDWFRAGEATSAILLTATRHGLASSPLTQPLEVDDTREFIRSHVTTARHLPPADLAEDRVDTRRSRGPAADAAATA